MGLHQTPTPNIGFSKVGLSLQSETLIVGFGFRIAISDRRTTDPLDVLLRNATIFMWVTPTILMGPSRL